MNKKLTYFQATDCLYELTLNLERIGVSLSCNDLLHNSNASKSIGNLMSFKTFALIPSLPLYWNRTKLTVKYAGKRLIFDYETFECG